MTRHDGDDDEKKVYYFVKEKKGEKRVPLLFTLLCKSFGSRNDNSKNNVVDDDEFSLFASDFTRQHTARKMVEEETKGNCIISNITSLSSSHCKCIQVVYILQYICKICCFTHLHNIMLNSTQPRLCSLSLSWKFSWVNSSRQSSLLSSSSSLFAKRAAAWIIVTVIK